MRRSTFRILFYIKRGNPKKNGDVVIMGRITIDGERSQFSTKLEINPSGWDNKSGKATMHYNKLMDVNGYANPDSIKNALFGLEEKSKTIMYYFNKFNE